MDKAGEIGENGFWLGEWLLGEGRPVRLIKGFVIGLESGPISKGLVVIEEVETTVGMEMRITR